MIGVALVVVFIVARTVFFTVSERQHALVIAFGNPQEVLIDDPGLHVKLPWYDVVFIDSWNLEYDIRQGQELEIIAANEERLIIDAYVRYRIVEPLMYYEAFKSGAGNWRTLKDTGDTRLGSVLNGALRNSLGEVTINEIITTKRVELMQQIQRQVAEEARGFGVEIVDVRIRRADFPEQNAERVYERMRSERQQQAQRIRAEGREQAARIEATAQKERTQIVAEAEEQSQRIRGRADRQRNAIYNEAYSRDPEFFAFYRSLTSYETALQDGQTTIILSPDSEFFRYFENVNGN
ncbi:protease modulator HflC [Aquisalinus flavus]|nr:protease modulator HflC [Aquisalinus flavus]UNE49213.1 protease modulator HflC [Aquisalinus flavus]